MTGSELVLAAAVIVVGQLGVAVWLRAAIAARPATGPRPGRADDFRAYQAVAGEIAKRQVAVLADMAEEIQVFERACLAHARRLCELMIAEARKAGHGDVPDTAPNDLEAAMAALVGLVSKPLDEAAHQRIRKDVEPNATVLLTYAEQTRNRLEEHRFWLGMALEQELRAYVTGMGRTFADLSPEPTAFRRSESRYRELMAAHPEAARAIEGLSAVSLLPPLGARPA